MTRDLRSVLDDFGESSGRELSRRAPDPGAQVRDVTRRVVRRRTARAAGAVGGVAGLALLGVLAGQGLLTVQPAPPAREPSPPASVSASPSPSLAPTPAVTAPAVVATEPPVVAPTTPTLVLGAGGAVADLGREPDAAAAVAYLTEVFGAPPEDVNAESPVCALNGDPGGLLRWGNVTLVLRTRADDGSPVDQPVVQGWGVWSSGPADASWDGPWRAVEVRTAEGLGVGEPVSRLRELYPEVQGGEAWFGPPTHFWSVGEFPLGYAFVTEGGAAQSPVTRIAGGYECGE